MIIRPFEEEDATAVRELFVTINRLLSPLQMRDAFEAYISRSLAEKWTGSTNTTMIGKEDSGLQPGVRKLLVCLALSLLLPIP
jgi:hypothetical protein